MERDPETCVIALVPHSWADNWGVRHHVLSRLSRYYHVLWVPPMPGWRAAWIPEKKAPVGEAPVPEGLSVLTHSRLYPAFFKPDWLAEFTRSRVAARMIREVRNSGLEKIVLYLWRPQFSPWLEQLPNDLSIYHIDDEYSFSATEVPVTPEEKRLIESVDRVFIHSPGLMEKKGRINPHTEFIPNGVNYSAFAEPVSAAADLAAIPGPRIGCVGVIKKQLDLELLAALAEARPEWSFVMVGPVGNVSGKEPWLAKLEASDNVYLLGARATDELPGYVQYLDVCTMSYIANAYTQYIYPLKMHEYLAAGRPVVSTPIRTVRSFERVVDFAESKEEWLQAIENNLAPEAHTDAQRAARQSVAREHDWDRVVEKVVAQIKAGLDG